jgi:DNA adenine methylase
LSEKLFNSIKTKIYNLDYQVIVNKFINDKNAFFYFDPPYKTANQKLYKHNTFDYIKFLDLVKKIKGKFILSLDDCTENRELFKEFNIFYEQKRYTAFTPKTKMGKELIITNFDVEYFTDKKSKKTKSRTKYFQKYYEKRKQQKKLYQRKRY